MSTKALERLVGTWTTVASHPAMPGVVVHGTVDEVIASSHLTTYVVSSGENDNLNALSEQLTGKPGIDMVAPFGTSLHVSGRDAAKLEAAIAPYRKRKGLDWQRSEPSLEDVFIDLMRRSQDNFP